MALGKDKIIHATVCCVATIGMSLITAFFGKAVSLVSGTAFSLGLGLGKECGDFFNPKSEWDWKDLVADLVGTAIGLFLSFLGWVIFKR